MLQLRAPASPASPPSKFASTDIFHASSMLLGTVHIVCIVTIVVWPYHAEGISSRLIVAI